jgi:nucleoside-diphosphate-sugar epimerase
MKLILTGVSGFIGSELVRTLLIDPTVTNIQILLRPLPGISAIERWERLTASWLAHGFRYSEKNRAKTLILTSDLSEKSTPLKLQPADYFIHLAASTNLGDPIHLARRNNLFTTQSALRIAEKVPNISRFIHLSTAYVAGKQKGIIRENMATLEQKFHNPYEKSKLEAEKCVESFGLPYTILRPSIVVGRSDNGYAPKMQVLYSAWRAWLSGYLPRAPIDPKGWVDIVPVDYVCAAICALGFHPAATGQTFHICAGKKRVRSLEILETACQTFKRDLPKFAPPWIVEYLRHPWVSRNLPHELNAMIEIMRWHVPYLGMKNKLFDMSKAELLLQKSQLNCPDFSTYGHHLFEYLQHTSWGKRPHRLRARLPAEEEACSA